MMIGLFTNLKAINDLNVMKNCDKQEFIDMPRDMPKRQLLQTSLKGAKE